MKTLLPSSATLLLFIVPYTTDSSRRRTRRWNFSFEFYLCFSTCITCHLFIFTIPTSLPGSWTQETATPYLIFQFIAKQFQSCSIDFWFPTYDICFDWNQSTLTTIFKNLPVWPMYFITLDLFTPNTLRANIPNIFASLSTSWQSWQSPPAPTSPSPYLPLKKKKKIYIYSINRNKKVIIIIKFRVLWIINSLRYCYIIILNTISND